HGLAEDGHYYAYMPANGEAASAINVLNESMLATEVLGGEQLVLPWLPYWLGSTTGATVGAIVGGIALVGGSIALATSDGSSGGSSTPAPQPDPQPEPTPTNTDPVANDDTASTAYGTPLHNINVLANDSDADGDNLSVSAVSLTNPSQGTVSVNPDGTINFTPAEGVTGDVLINYTVSDGKGGTDTATLTVTVGAAPIPTPPTPNNTDPVANDDTASTAYGTPLHNINVLANDSDADGDSLSVSAVTLANPNQGTVSVNPDGTINFKPADGVTGDVVINYTVSDGKGGTDTATLTVSVGAAPIPTPPAPNNTDPVANDDTASTEYGTALNNINVLSNDTDADGDNLSVSAVTLANPSQGTVSVNPDGTINFKPADGVTGDVVINYTVSDGKGGTDTATLMVTVGAAPIPTPPTPNNTDPVANDDTANTAYGTALNNINVLSNDSDADGDNLSVSAVSLTNPSQGTVSVNPDGTINFTPAEGVTGDVLINYTVSDGKGGTDTATLTVSVGAAPIPTPPTPNNTDPVANDDTANTAYGTALNNINVLSNDTDADGDNLSVSAVSLTNPSQGTVSVNPDGTINFKPADGVTGDVVINYTVSDGKGGTDTATLTVSVGAAPIPTPPAPNNTDPVANDDTANTAYGTALNNINVLSNDTDADGDSLSVSAVSLTNPSQGTVSVNPDGTINFTPADGVTGDVVINYTVSDGKGGTDTATLTVTVGAAPIPTPPAPNNTDPVANDDTANTAYGTALNNINVLSNDTDADGDSLSVSAVSLTNPSQGTVSVNPDGTINFTPADGVTGDVVINYTVSDGKGGTDTATLTVTVGAAPIPTPPAPNNTDPVANDDTASTEYGTALNNINVLANDSDADGDNLSVSAVSLTNPNQGTVSVNPDGTINFTPAEGVTGDVVINYTVSDGKGGTDTATLTVTVGAAPIPTPPAPNNTDPVANDDTASTAYGTPLHNINVLANDSDADGDNLSVSAVSLTNPSQGTVSVNPDGTINFTPADGVTGDVVINYTVSDGKGGTDTATLTVSVGAAPVTPPVNNAPVANDDTASTQAGQAVTVNVLTNDSDPDGDQLTVSEATLADPSQGTLVKNSDGTLTFTPATGVTGDVVINYTISDGNGGTDSSTVTVNVNGKPVANDDSASAQAGQPVTIDVVANDSDPDNNPLTVSEATLSTADAGKGSVSIVDNKVVFTPNAGVTGDVVINYTISDGKGGTDTATVTVTVSVPLPPAPTATPYHDNGSDPTDPTDDIIGVIVTFPDDLSNVDSLTLSYTNNNGIDKSEYTLTKNPTTGEWELPQAAKDAGLTLGTDDQDNPTVIVPIEQLIHGQTVTAYTSNDSGNSDNATGKPYITDYKDPLDLNRKNIYGKDVDERIQADDPTNPTDDEKADAIATLKLANVTDAEVTAALNNSEHPPVWNDTDKTLKITYADGSSDVIPYAELFSTEPPYVAPPEMRPMNEGDVRIYFPETKVSVKLSFEDESDNPVTIYVINNADGTWAAYYTESVDGEGNTEYSNPVPSSVLNIGDGDYATLNRDAVKDDTEVTAVSYNRAGDQSESTTVITLSDEQTYDPTNPDQTITPPESLVDYTPDNIDDLIAVWNTAGISGAVTTYNESERNASIPTENGEEYTNLSRIEMNGGLDETVTYVIPGNMQASQDTNVAVKVIGETALVIGGGIYGTTYTAESGTPALIDFSYGLSQNTTGNSSIARTGVELSGGADLLWVGGTNANYDLYYNASTGYTLVKAGETPPANAGTKVESSSTSSTGGTIRHAEILMDGMMNTGLDQETEAINGDDTLIVSGISDTTAAQERTNAAIYNSLITLGSGNDTIITTGGTGQTDYSGMILESTIVVVSVNGTYPQETTYWTPAGDEIPYTYLGDNTIITTGLQNSVVDLRGYKDEDYDGEYESNPDTVNDDTLSIEYGTNNGDYSSTGNQIHMGYGMDTLEFTGSGQEYELSKLSSTPMSVETISITGSDNTVVVKLSDLVDTGTGEILIDSEIGQAGRYVMRIGDTSDGDAGNQLKLDSDFAYTGYVEVSNNNQEYYVYQSQTYSDLFVFVDKDLAVI
ncbi:beta strand repeat-containing protein, partial [Lonepinella koalarum]